MRHFTKGSGHYEHGDRDRDGSAGRFLPSWFSVLQWISAWPVVLLAAPVGGGVAGQGQAPFARIPDDVRCPQCALELERVATFGGSRLCLGNVLDATESYWVLPTNCEASEVAVFDRSSGRFIQLLGRSGQGPGEREYVNYLSVDEAQRIHVLTGTRWQVYNADLTLASETPFAEGTVSDMIGARVLNLTSFDEALVGYTLHVLDPDSHAILRSFGPGSFRSWSSLLSRRRLAPGSAGDFWSIELQAYRAAKWSRGGDRLLGIERSGTVFEAYEERFDGSQPLTQGLIELNPRQLLVAMTVASSDRIVTPPTGKGLDESRRMKPPNFWHINRDTVLEVLDIEAGAVVVREKFDEYVEGVIPEQGLVWSYSEVGEDLMVDVYAVLWRDREEE